MRTKALAVLLAAATAVVALGFSAGPGEVAPAAKSPARATVAGTKYVGEFDVAPAPREKESVFSIPPGEETPIRIDTAAKDADAEDWGHAPLKVSDAWKVTKGRGVTVAVLDTGIDLHHRDLEKQVVATRNFSGSRNGVSDVQGHGTWCAGCVAAAEDGWGMVGVAPQAKLLIGKVLGDSGSGSSSAIAAGIDWATDNGADVISMSLGGGSPDTATRKACQRATAAGVIVVAAAGNSGPGRDAVGYPGGYPEVFCVAAIDSNLKVADFSSRGANVFVAGPGVNCRSTYPGNRFASMSGTSMATPYVAGTAALWIAAHPEIKKPDRPAAFRKALVAACKDLPPTGRDTASGYGYPVLPDLVARPDGGKSPDDPAPKLPGTFLKWDDLTPDAQKRLRDAGLDPSKLPG